MRNRIIELTRALVAIPTHEREDEAQALLADELETAGFDCRLQRIAEGRSNLIAKRGEGGVFLCSHIDTHPPHDHSDPLTMKIEDDHLVGRGVLDAKGQIAAMVAAVEAEPGAPALIIVTCDEESGGLGSERVEIPAGPWFNQGGIVLEPTDLKICTAQTGHIDLAVSAAGTPGHAYAPSTEGSPIRAVLSVIEELDTCRFLKDDHALLGRPRVNIGTISGGQHRWRRASHASIDFSLGVVPGTDLTEASEEVNSRLADLVRRWRSSGVTLTFEVIDQSPPLEVPSDLEIASLLADAPGTPLHPGGMPSWTDAGHLAHLHGLACVIFGAGDLSVAHSDHETVAIPDLERLASILRGVVSAAGTAR